MASRDWAEKDFYKILGIDESATKDDIKKAYKKLARQYHPDNNKGDKGAEARFKEISEAYSILSNDQKRAEYDQMRRLFEAGGDRFYGFTPGGQGGVRINIGDLFGDEGGRGGGFFEDLFGFGPRQARGSDAETEVTLSFEESIEGTTVQLRDGTKVRIPAGIGDGGRVKVAGKGGPGANGGTAGDLYVRVRVQPHPVFGKSKGGDLQITLPVTFTEAALGAKVEVPTLDEPVTVKIPPGTPNGKVLRVRGRGAPKARGGTGDLLVKVEVEVPQKLTNKEKDLLQRFDEEHKESPRAHLERYINRSNEQGVA